MTKKEAQKRVLQNGKPLDLDKFEWDEKTNTFSSNEDRLVLDFNGKIDCTFKTGFDCTFKTDSYCTFETEKKCVVVRRDIYEVIELDGTEKIKLNEDCISGYVVLEDKELSLSGEEVEVKIKGKTYKAIIN